MRKELTLFIVEVIKVSPHTERESVASNTYIKYFKLLNY